MKKLKISKKLLNTLRRRQMWQKATGIVKLFEEIQPISKIYLYGSFATSKLEPKDVDLIILIKKLVLKNEPKSWAVNIQIAPDNKYGKLILKDASKHMRLLGGIKKLK